MHGTAVHHAHRTPQTPRQVSDPTAKCRLQAASALYEMEKARVKSFLAELDRKVLDVRVQILEERYGALLRSSDE